MKKVQWFFGMLFSFALLLVLLISSFEFAAYGDFHFYEKEYRKYDVVSDLDMKLEDVMDVTHEMMEYLIGNRENLDVYTTVEGKEQNFFNEQDKLHMADVRNLFLGGITVRRVSLVVMLISLGILLVTRADWKRILARGYQISLGITVVGVGILAGTLILDFDRAFTVFHEIFFTNDLWIFDPATDYMIRMLPEGFFYDMALRIGEIFLAGMLVCFGISMLLIRKSAGNRKNKI